MQPGDRVLFVAERDAAPQPGTVARRYGCWVDVQLDDGKLVDQVFAASTHFQSPKGHYCVISQSVNHSG